MFKNYKYRIYPTKSQVFILNRWLYLCRQLYNAMLEQRIAVWHQRHKSVHKFAQMKELPALKVEFPEYAQVNSQVLADVAKRLDKSFQRFFKGGGFPKFQGRNRYDSLTYSQHGWKLRGEQLVLSNCGAIPVKLSRKVDGDIKTVTIKRTKTGKWFVCVVCANVPAPQYPPTDKATGIDLGIEALATTSDGERFENAQYLKRKLKHLRRVNRHLSRQRRGSNRRKKTVRQIQQIHERIANQRADAHHKASTKLVRENAEIHMERIDPAFMLANRRLARAASDVGWGQFKRFLQMKAAAAGRKIIEKNPRNTSQECSGCGQLVPKKLNVRWHTCDCGTSLHRDHNAALVILNRPA